MSKSAALVAILLNFGFSTVVFSVYGVSLGTFVACIFVAIGLAGLIDVALA